MKNFRASSIPRYSVLYLPHKFGNSEHSLSKLFVVICHKDEYAICLKATSKVDIYLNNEEQMAGCVFYEAGEVAVFERDTAIQPDNQIPIKHSEIEEAYRKNSCDICGQLPTTFEKRLIAAAKNSATLSPRERKRLLLVLGKS